MNKILITSAFAYLFLITASSVSADVKNCRPIYGGGQTCIQSQNFTIDKTIQDPKSQKFVDNLGINDATFGPATTINFAITVKNISKGDLTNIQVTDTFPQFVDFAEGNGDYDNATRTLTFPIAKLQANESKTYLVKATVVNKDNLSENFKGCIANLVQAEIKEDISADNTQFCLTASGTTQSITKKPVAPTQIPATTKGGQPVHQAPKSENSPATGPEALSLIALLPSGVAGFLLRKKVLRG